jgi:hypothetical protein
MNQYPPPYPPLQPPKKGLSTAAILVIFCGAVIAVCAIGIGTAVLFYHSNTGKESVQQNTDTVIPAPPPVANTPDNQRERKGVPQPKASTKWDSDAMKMEAYRVAKEYVAGRLKAPASADFPWIWDSDVGVIHHGKGKFEIAGYVDAQNAFGAKLRTYYVCELQQSGSSWKLISLSMK